MKKFFRALAVVLALTLVIGTIPAMAADTLSLKKDSKIVYIGGAIGTTVDGKQCKLTNKYKLSKLVDGFDPETMDIKLSAANKNIVSTSDAYDRVYAKSIGKTNVTVSVYSKATGNLVQAFTVKVQVKKNATEDSFVVNWGDIVDGGKLGVNTEYTVTMPRVDANGKWLDTDKRGLVASDESVEIKATNKYKTAYTVKPTKAGEFTLTASAYQSVLYPQTVISEGVTVKAGYTALAVSQYSLREAIVTFDTNVAGLNIDNFTAYYMLDGVKCPTLTTEVVPINENTVKVTFFSNFIYGREYFVEYDGETVDSFKAITVDANSVQSIELPAQDIIAGKEDAVLAFKLIGPDGIILATKMSELVPELDGIFNFSCADEDRVTMYLTPSTGGIYFANAGDKVTVKVEYSWYNDLVDKKVEGSGVVTSVKAPDWTLTEAKLAITDADADPFKNGASSAVARFAQGDAVILQGKFVYTKDYVNQTWGITDTNRDTTLAAKQFEVFSSDEKIVMTQEDFGKTYTDINGVTVNSGIKLVANNTGSCTILVYEVVKDENGLATRGNLVATLPVTVVAARKADSAKATPSKNNLNKGWSTSADSTDSITFTVSLYDQYGDLLNNRKDYDGNVLTSFVDASASKDKNGNTLVNVGELAGTKYGWNYWSGNEAKLTSFAGLDGIDVAKKTAVTLTFGAYYNNESWNVKRATANIYLVNETGAAKQSPVISATELNTTIDPNSAAQRKAITVSLVGTTKSGYSVAGEAVELYTNIENNRFISKISGDAFAGSYIYTVQRDGQYITNRATLTSINGDTQYGVTSGASINFNDNTFTNFEINGGQLSKLQTGKYVINAYVGVAGKENGKDVVTFRLLGTQSFTVKDETKAPVITQLKDNIADSVVTNNATIGEAFRVGWTGSWDVQNVTGTNYAWTESTINATDKRDSVYVSTANVTTKFSIQDTLTDWSTTNDISWTFKNVAVKALLWKTTVKQLDDQDIR